MTTTETRLFMFNAPASTLPSPGETGTLGINLYEPAIVARFGEGWRPVSHTVAPMDDDALLVTVLAERTTEAPDSLDQIG